MTGVIGLIGKKRSGKNTFASVFTEEFGWKEAAFADPLRTMLLDLDPLIIAPSVRLSDIVNRHGWEVAKGEPEVRRLMQVFGTEVIRKRVGETYWTDVMATRLGGALYAGKRTIISDVRFPNEAELTAEYGGTLVRIERPGLTAGDAHASETALDNFPVDLTVTNDGDLWSFMDQARNIAQTYINTETEEAA